MSVYVIKREDGTYRGHDGQPCRSLREAAHYENLAEARRRCHEYHPDEGFTVREVTDKEVAK